MNIQLKMKTTLLATAVSLALSACGGGGNSGDGTPQPGNSAPTDINLTSSEVYEKMDGAVVGQLSAVDSDSNESFEYSVDNDLFSIDGTTLTLANDYQANFASDDAILSVAVTVTDKGNNTYTKNFNVDVLVATPENGKYEFESQITSGSAVSYTGQVARHTLILELNNFVANLQPADYTSKQDVIDALNLRFTDEEDQASDLPLTIETSPNVLQNTVREISDGKNLVGKIAGNDEKGQHKDWLNGDFEGWVDTTQTPEEFVTQLFDMIADQVVELNGNNDRYDPAGNIISSHYVTTDGLDLKQLLQKFLLGAIALSQGTDDYLHGDDDAQEFKKGLYTDNVQDGTKPYTKLEHQMDEGFGYFGAALDYASYNDDLIAGTGYKDSDNDGTIDLTKEYNFGNSVNAAKRDIGSSQNLTQEAIDAFMKLRAMANALAATQAELTLDQFNAMEKQAEAASIAWEKSISATIIHYINDTNADLETLKTGTYSQSDFANLAKHWSEMKGFALNLQFNPYSPVTDTDFSQINALMADKPVISGVDEIDAYTADLIAARDLLQAAYGFSDEDVTNW